MQSPRCKTPVPRPHQFRLLLFALVSSSVWSAPVARGDGAGDASGSQIGRHAVVTGIFGIGLHADAVRRFALGANALGASLTHHGVKAERVLMITESCWALLDSSTQDKVSMMWDLRYVETIMCKVNQPALFGIYGQHSTQYAEHLQSYMPATCTKLLAWKMTEYQKVLWMDSDTMVTADISHVFDVDAAFAAASDPCTQIMFNAGVILLQPNDEVFQELQDVASTIGSFDAADQGVLNLHFGVHWQQAAVLDGGKVTKLPQYMNAPPNLGATWSHLGQIFGDMLKARGLPDQVMSPNQVIHFMGQREKPWVVLEPVMRLFGSNNPVELQKAIQAIPNFPVYQQWADRLAAVDKLQSSRSSSKDEL